MLRAFTPGSPYKKKAKSIAILWTLLILTACFTPGKDIPKVDVPLIDKWVHLVLFGGFTFLWFCARPVPSKRWVVALFLISVAFGSFIEIMQGLLSFLGRSMELMDAVADGIGGLLGIGLFLLVARLTHKRKM